MIPNTFLYTDEDWRNLANLYEGCFRITYNNIVKKRNKENEEFFRKCRIR